MPEVANPLPLQPRSIIPQQQDYLSQTQQSLQYAIQTYIQYERERAYRQSIETGSEINGEITNANLTEQQLRLLEHISGNHLVFAYGPNAVVFSPFINPEYPISQNQRRQPPKLEEILNQSRLYNPHRVGGFINYSYFGNGRGPLNEDLEYGNELSIWRESKYLKWLKEKKQKLEYRRKKVNKK
ncbi:MAG: hypothetical protein EZS28_002953 [Streblomastix strix]|uniref:Uncharacterized protein n=1 Tax=Streblomastix strix TaxID=222440 RepID=A0A5J4X2S7_9EUKA|nr:MAG: hypothetical protein EZS28_002953 [Streblomastix strix]